MDQQEKAAAPERRAEPTVAVPSKETPKEKVVAVAPPNYVDGSSVGTTPLFSRLSVIVGLLVLVAGVGTRMLWLKHPESVVFDEVHFGKFTRWYLRREYFFDIHPPLGKFFILLAAQITGFPDSFNFDNIGVSMPKGGAHVWLRFMPALFGGLVPFVAYATSLHMTGSVAAAGLAAAMVCFDNAFLVESRLILTDAFLFFFIAFAVYANLKLFNEAKWNLKRVMWLVLAGLFLGAAPSVKWTGLSVVAMCGLGHLSHSIRLLWVAYHSPERLKRLEKAIRDILITGVVLVGLMSAVYVGSWYWHFRWANRQGDNWFAHERWPSPEELARMPEGQRPTFWEKFVSLHQTMLSMNAGMDANHPHCSSWLSWPFMERGVAYWGGGGRANIYCIGNALVWWFSTAMLCVFFVDLLRIGGRWAPTHNDEVYLKRGRFLILGHLFNWVPYYGVSRCAYLYHYLPSLYYLSLLAACVLAYWIRVERIRGYVAGALIAAALWGFVYWAPFSYGLALTEDQRRARMWNPNWA